jgi:hypothetical protein
MIDVAERQVTPAFDEVELVAVVVVATGQPQVEERGPEGERPGNSAGHATDIA